MALGYNTALQRLAASNTGLTDIDLSANTALINLHLSGCSSLQILDLTSNTVIDLVDLTNTSISEFIIPVNTSLKTLNLTGNTTLLALNISESTSITIKNGQVIRGGFVRTNGVGISLTSYKKVTQAEARNYWVGLGFGLLSAAIIDKINSNNADLGLLLTNNGFDNYLQINTGYWTGMVAGEGATYRVYNFAKCTDGYAVPSKAIESFGCFTY